MHGKLIGCEFLKDLLGTSAFSLARPARVSSVTKVTPTPDALAVPSSVAPSSDAPPAHLQFALKHEGLQLQAAILALKRLAGKEVSQTFQNSPSSAYLRQICYFCELVNSATLEGLPQ